MGSMRGRRREKWCVQPLSPLREGPDLEMQLGDQQGSKKESSWEVIREWFRLQKNIPGGGGGGGGSTLGFAMSLYVGEVGDNNLQLANRQDLRLLLGVLGCPLAPIPLAVDIPIIHRPRISIKDIPIETSSAHYIIQQYLAAAGCLKKQQQQQQGSGGMMINNMYTTGVVKMICCETEISFRNKVGDNKDVKTLGTRSGENGCFVLWQMKPMMWSLELALGTAHKVIAGSDGNIVWRHTPWLGTHVAKGPHRPLRRLIQGLDPKSTASLFAKAQCLGEKRIGEDDCFVLKVAADPAVVMERNEGPAEVVRHVLYGYFSQKSGLLIYMEDSHLTRVLTHHQAATAASKDNDGSSVYWETTIGSSIGDYREVDGVLIAHQGRTIATVFRFGEPTSNNMQHDQEYYSRTRMEEIWRIDDVVFNVPGLSIDSFIPPADIFEQH